MSPSEHRLYLRVLSHYCTGAFPQEAHDLLAQRERDDFDPAECVMHLRLDLGSSVMAERRKNQADRAKLRAHLGKKRLAPGEGPVFVARPFAATLNEYANLDPWLRTTMRNLLDEVVAQQIQKSPRARIPMTNLAKPRKSGFARPRWTGGRRRAVVLTRYACQPTDEPGSIDVSGGKFVLDALVRAGVLQDDNVEWCARFAEWKHVPSSQSGWCEVDVYEMKNPGAKS